METATFEWHRQQMEYLGDGPIQNGHRCIDLSEYLPLFRTDVTLLLKIISVRIRYKQLGAYGAFFFFF